MLSKLVCNPSLHSDMRGFSKMPLKGWIGAGVEIKIFYTVPKTTSKKRLKV